MRARANRHGRLPRRLFVRRPLATLSFNEIVSGAVEFLRSEWPDELGKLTWRVADLPPMAKDGELPRWAADPNTFRITLFRVPIERLTHIRRPDKLDERFHIEQFVFFAAASLIDKDPWDLMPERFRH